MKPEEAACEGLFMAFQYPVEIPGISNAYFLRAAVNAIRKYRGEEELDAMDFLPLLKEKMRLLEMDERFLNRPVNEGFSGGEKKRNEIVQMAVLEPRMAILDETDSGLDIDALKIVAKGVNAMRSADRAILGVTHYQRLLNYIVPDYVHVLVDGRIVKSGAACQLVFLNGRFAPELSDLGSLPQGVRAGSLAEALTQNGEFLEAHLGRYLNIDRDAFCALNTAFIEDGAYVYLPRRTVLEAPICFLFISIPGDDPEMSNPRNLIVAEDATEASIVEDYVSLGSGVFFSNVVTELAAGEDAVISHYLIERDDRR